MFDLDARRMSIRLWFKYFLFFSDIMDMKTGEKITVPGGSVKVTTCATDGKQMVFNEEFMETLDATEQNFIVCRMLLAVARKHPYMRMGRDPDFWNVACEQFILGELKQFVEHLKEKKSSIPISVPEGIIIDPRFEGMSEYEIYEWLLENAEKTNTPQQNQTGDVVDSSLSPAQVKDEISKIQKRTRMAEAAAKMAGDGNSFWSKLADDCDDTGPDPEALLNRFVVNSLPTARTWSRPDPRYLAMQQYSPGELKNNIGEIAMGIDCSGSMDRNQIAECLGWVKSVSQICKPSKITVMYFCCEVERADEFKWNEPFEMPEEIPNGGTSFRAVHDYMERNEIEPKCMIWLTDGYDAAPPEPNHPTIWIMTTDVDAPFGERVQFSTKGD